MKLTLEIALGIVLGWAAIKGLEKAQERSNPPEAATPSEISYDPTRVICDREHTAFDLAGNTYCQQPHGPHGPDSKPVESRIISQTPRPARP